jgi:hypothetical protein
VDFFQRPSQATNILITMHISAAKAILLLSSPSSPKQRPSGMRVAQQDAMEQAGYETDITT